MVAKVPKSALWQKDCNTRMIRNDDYEVQTNYTFVFYFLVIMFILCYWFDQKTGIMFTGYFNFS